MGLQDLLQAGQPMRSRITEVLEAEANAHQDINRNWVQVYEPMRLLVLPSSSPLAREDPVY